MKITFTWAQKWMQAWFSFCCLTLIYNAMLSLKIILKCAHVRIGYLCGTWMLRVLHSFWTCWKLCFWGEQHGKKESTAVREVILGKKIGVCVFVVWFRPLLQKLKFLCYGSLFKCVWTLQNKNSCLVAVCRKQWWTIAWLDVCCILKCLHNASMPATKFTIVLMQKMWWRLRNRCSFKCICDDNRCRHELVLLCLSVANWKKSELTLNTFTVSFCFGSLIMKKVLVTNRIQGMYL